MTKKQKVCAIIAELRVLYPDAACSLNYAKPYELLFSTRLAAQCTDVRVNEVCKTLYAELPTLSDIAACDIARLEGMVRTCGLFRTKARDIKACANELLERFDGVVPSTMEGLLSLPGVGRKTANLILGDVFGKPAIVCDTHCIRLSNRLGLVSVKDPTRVERELVKIVPACDGAMMCHRFVLHGRAVCTARSPKCSECTLSGICNAVERGV